VTTTRDAIRFPLLFSAFATLLIALWAGLLRLGWELPPLRSDGATVHGALMVSGFLGILIGLERAVAATGFAEKPWLRIPPYSAPLLTALGSIILLVGLPKPGVLLISLGSLLLVDLFVYFICKHIALYTVVMGLGTVAWFVGNFLWLQDKPLYQATPWWMAFLILTIAGERLELSQVRWCLSPNAYRLFKLAAGVFLTGVALTVFSWNVGIRMMGLGAVALAAWLLCYDIARRTIRQRDLPRFIATCLLAGYIWLGIGGLLTIYFGGAKAGLHYDAFLHAVFLGFVFSMIFAHAPIILPSITGFSVTYHRRFYLHLILLHLSLLLRVGGNLGLGLSARRWGGLLNVVVLLIFLGSTAYAVLSSYISFQFNLKRSPATTLAFLFPLPVFVLGVALVGIGLLAKPVPSIASNPAEFATAVQQAGYDPAFVSRGQALFRSSCSSCHGLDARGILGVGKNLSDSEFVDGLSDAALHEFIIRGRSLWDPDNTTGVEMPPRGGNPALSSDDLDHIIAYLRFITAQSR
jgi:mono/diheme cytochrome c family protein